jgi:hypothetical protein
MKFNTTELYQNLGFVLHPSHGIQQHNGNKYIDAVKNPSVICCTISRPPILYGKRQNVSIFSSKSGPLLISSCYTVQWSEALPVQKLVSNIGPWQPATLCDREVNKLPACFAVIFQGSCFCGGRGGVVSRTKPSLHPRASRIYRK